MLLVDNHSIDTDVTGTESELQHFQMISNDHPYVIKWPNK